MNALIDELAAKAGIGDAVAEKTIGIMLDYLRSQGPAEPVQLLIDHMPGAEAAIAAARNGHGLSQLMGSGLMLAGTRLRGLGLAMTDIQNIARVLFAFGRDRIGAERMGTIIAGTPGLGQFA